MTLSQRSIAEFLGTFWLVFIGCGTALFASAVPDSGVGLLGIALAFGLSVTTMAYALGSISGCHLNPAVTLGLTLAGRFNRKDVVPYVMAQVLGGIVGAGLLYVIASGHADFNVAEGFASTGMGEHSSGGFSLMAGVVMECVMTMMFVVIILGATDRNAPAGFAPLAIGLALVLIHLVAIQVSGASVNPARSTATAVFEGGWALSQLWIYWVAPLVGGAVGGTLYRMFNEH